MTIREIAEAAGVTHPLVHQYVGPKKDVIDAVVKRGAPHRRQIVLDHPDLREAVPAVARDVIARKVHSRAILRSAMDGVEYAPFEDRLEAGRTLLELARSSISQGRSRPPALDPVDPRIALAAAVALMFGWVGGEDWLIALFDLQDEDLEEVRGQMADLCLSLSDLVFPPAGDPRSEDA